MTQRYKMDGWARGRHAEAAHTVDIVFGYSNISEGNQILGSQSKYGGSRGAHRLPGDPRAATLSATLSHESNEADWNVGGPSTCLMS
jgi:hypothetical protein